MIYSCITNIDVNPCYFGKREEGWEREIVTPKNITVSKINNFVLDILQGMKRSYLSTNNVYTSSGDNENTNLLLYPIKFVN